MDHEKNIEILTPRLLLRVPKIEDAAEVNAAINQNWHELQKWMSWSFDGQNTLEASKHYISVIVPEQMEQGFLPLLGFCRNSGKYVVSTGIAIEDGKPLTGYWVAPEFFGQRYAAEAANAVIRYAFGVRKYDRFHINHYGGNEKSEKVIRALGFVEDGIREKAKERCLDGVLLDIHDYVMTDPAVLPHLDVEWKF